MKTKPPDNSKFPYKTVKTSLKSILKNYEEVQPKLNEIVERCNEIVIRAYQFIKLYILYKYNNKENLPEINEKFILYCIKAIGQRDNRGAKSKDKVLKDELEDFYNNEYKPLINKEKIDMKCLTYLLPYLSTQILTCISNNIQERFIKHITRFILFIAGKAYDKSKNSPSKKKFLLNQLKYAILNNDKVPNIFKDWFNYFRPKLLPETIEKCVLYDLKKNPLKYLRYSLYINYQLETRGFKSYQTIPLRKNIIPKYITFDTASLISILEETGKYELTKNLKENREKIWSKYFKLSKRIFQKKGYTFNFMIQTDGIGVSLLFVREDLKDKKYKIVKGSSNKNEGEIPYITDLDISKLNSLKGRNMVGCDPGKQSLVYMTDVKSRLRYTASQRRVETYSKRNNRIILNEKKKNGITELETEFSKHNSKTNNYDKFKEYIKEKTILNDKTRDFYYKPLFRKLKWRHYIYTQKSEDKFLNRIGETFGKDCVIIFGNWSKDTQMKHTMPTMGKGLRLLISKRYDTYLLDEFRTSKLCCNCWEFLENYKLPISKDNFNKKRLYRLLRCKGCIGTPCDDTVFFTRDHNSALNIRNLGKYWINFQTRPKEFCKVLRNQIYSCQ